MEIMNMSSLKPILGVTAAICAMVAVSQYVTPHQFWYYETSAHAKAPAEALEQSLRAYALGQRAEIQRLDAHTVGYRFYGESPAVAKQRALLAWKSANGDLLRQGFGPVWRTDAEFHQTMASPDSRYARWWIALPAASASLAAVLGVALMAITRVGRRQEVAGTAVAA
jgi:cytochrome c-type biogenesis protein CcmE